MKAAIEYMPEASFELPYDGGSKMLLVTELEDKDFLAGLFNAMYDELPEPKKKKQRR